MGFMFGQGFDSPHIPGRGKHFLQTLTHDLYKTVDMGNMITPPADLSQ